ncbi:hypothetical protein [Nonomuraea angiospora]|uniref:hypothetical protein n=1 Tax=Nonomuraea angiospora TaxID=46172 RepID=UPI0029A4CCAB|nr:hypothetical protein [Nonomuraea angiospora]MDX3106948.1 hypothetical protein [Nonomuraea angiospora]
MADTAPIVAAILPTDTSPEVATATYTIDAVAAHPRKTDISRRSSATLDSRTRRAASAIRSGAAPSVSVRNESWNGRLAADATTTFGFTAAGTAATPALTCTAA